MNDTAQELARALAILTGETLAARQCGEEHPTVEKLVAYHEGDLSADHDQAIQDHLTLCPECPDLLLSLQDFSPMFPVSPASPASPASPNEEALSAAGIAAAWRRLRRRLLGEARFEKLPDLVRAWFALPQPALAFSGVLLVAALTAPWLLWAARAGPGEARILRTLELPPLVRGGPAIPAAVSITAPAQASQAVAFTLSPGTPYPQYHVEVLSSDGQSVLSKPWRPQADNELLVVELPARSLSAGEYRVQLRGVDAQGVSTPEPVEERRFRVSMPP